MHIAWLGKKSPFCGNVTYGREVTNSLLDRGYDVSFLHFAQDEAEDPTWSGRQEVPLPFIYKSQVYTIPAPKARNVLMRSLKQLKPDLVHASLTLSFLDFLLPEICEELNIPLVATFHPPFDGKRRNLKSGTQLFTYQLYAPFLAHYDRVIVFSQLQRNFLVRLGVPIEKLAVIPNGVDVNKYSPSSVDLNKYSAKTLNLKSRLNAKRLFVYQGRISAEKNVEALLKAWKQSDLGDSCKLLIVGNGALSSSLMPFYGEEDGIIWWGFEADEQRRIEILQAADVFILPSLLEGLSLSLLEAMSCGVACVATDAGADGEVLEDGAGVVLNTHRVMSQLRTLLPQFRDHPEWTTLLGEKARARVLDRYTLFNNITQLEKLYTEILESPRRMPLTPRAQSAS